MDVLVLDRELADSAVIALFSCCLDQRAGRQPPTKIGAPGGVASALCALVHNFGAVALLFNPVALLVA